MIGSTEKEAQDAVVQKLLVELEVEKLRLRSKRDSSPQRVVILTFAILIIVILSGLALGILALKGPGWVENAKNARIEESKNHQP